MKNQLAQYERLEVVDNFLYGMTETNLLQHFAFANNGFQIFLCLRDIENRGSRMTFLI